MNQLFDIQKGLADYWGVRAPAYADENRKEFDETRSSIWLSEIEGHIREAFPGKKPEDIHFLDIATGPGTFAIIMAKAGYHVTAVDLAPEMIEEARRNAGSLADRIDFRVMNAEEPDFPDEHFDVVFNRFVTWLLPRPEKAYGEWIRILKRQGLLLIYDASWYKGLYDEEAREEREKLSQSFASLQTRDKDGNILDAAFYRKMDDMAAELPVSYLVRPQWDRCVLRSYGMRPFIEEAVMERVFPQQEPAPFKTATPVFMVKGIKE